MSKRHQPNRIPSFQYHGIDLSTTSYTAPYREYIVKRIVLERENAANYNKLFPVLALFIWKRNGIVLDRILHSETQDGKGRVDTHFETTSRDVDKYIAENELDIVTLADLVSVINFGDEIPGFIGELYDVDNYCDVAKMWSQAMKSGQGNGGLANLGRVNEVRYRSGPNGDDSFTAETYVYTYRQHLTWKLEVGKITSREGINPDEDQDESDIDVEKDDEGDDLREVLETVNKSGSPALYTGPMTGVWLITTGFVKPTSMAVKDIDKDLVNCDDTEQY